MKILFSSTKTMVENKKENLSQPFFIKEAEELYKSIKSMKQEEIKSVFRLSDKLLDRFNEMLDCMRFDTYVTPAIEAFDGLMYKRLDYISLDDKAKKYLEDKLMICSGLYGLLRPNDGIYSYRLDFNDMPKLYGYWKDKLAKRLGDDVIVDVASAEFTKAIKPYISENKYYIVSFKSIEGGKIKHKATASKMARGYFVRWLAENNIESIEDIVKFREYGYGYNKEFSSEFNIIFTN